MHRGGPFQSSQVIDKRAAIHARIGAVLLATPGNERRDPDLAGLPAVLVVVVAVLGVERVWSPTGPAATVPRWWDRVDERHQLSQDQAHTLAEATTA